MKTAKKTRKAAAPRRDPMALIENKLYDRETIEFPGMKGRVVEKIEFFTMENHHALTIEFRDKTLLHLSLDPGYILQAVLGRRTREGLEVVYAWPTISLEV